LEFPDDIKPVGDGDYSGDKDTTERSEYQISGLAITSRIYEEYNTTPNYSEGTETCDLSLLRVLDALAPGLFLLHRLEYEMRLSNNMLEIEVKEL